MTNSLFGQKTPPWWTDGPFAAAGSARNRRANNSWAQLGLRPPSDFGHGAGKLGWDPNSRWGSREEMQAFYDQGMGALDEFGNSPFLPGSDIAPDVQHFANIKAMQRNDRLLEDAGRQGAEFFGQGRGALQQGANTFQTYRPGGAAALTSGYFGGIANNYAQQAGFGLNVAQARQMDAPDLMFRYNEKTRHAAQRRARQAGELQAGVAIAGLVLGALTGGVGLAAVGGLAGGALGGGGGGGGGAPGSSSFGAKAGGAPGNIAGNQNLGGTLGGPAGDVMGGGAAAGAEMGGGPGTGAATGGGKSGAGGGRPPVMQLYDQGFQFGGPGMSDPGGSGQPQGAPGGGGGPNARGGGAGQQGGSGGPQGEGGPGGGPASGGMGMGGGMGGTPPAGPLSGQVSGAVGMDPGITYQMIQGLRAEYVDPRIEFSQRLEVLGDMYAPQQASYQFAGAV